MSRRFQVVYDAVDAPALGEFWATALGYRQADPPLGLDTWEQAREHFGMTEEEFARYYAVIDPEGVGPRLYFQQVPEGKTAKNRLHLDLFVTDGPGQDPAERSALLDAERDRLVAAGAVLVAEVDEHESSWYVMADPEGNEFCLV